MKLATDEIFFINELHRISNVHAKDCLIFPDTLSFLVKKEDMGRAIGKNAANLKKLGNKTKKRVEVMEWGEDGETFIRQSLSSVQPEKVKEKEQENKTTMVVSLSSENRKKLLTSLGKLKRIKALAKRNYKVDDIRIR